LLGVVAIKDLKGLNIGGLYIGAGDQLQGFNFSFLGVGAPLFEDLQTALVVGGVSIEGMSIAPAYFRLKGDEGTLKGLAIRAFNHIQGRQQGFTLGLFNFCNDI
jgi:hypothetical protein